jgi:hypothetical protein
MEEGGVEWDEAEKQIRANKGDSKKALTVSVKSAANGSKRKAGEAVAEAVRESEEFSKRKPKKHKDGKKKL